MTNSVLLQINTQSLVQLINTLDLLKQNQITFHIIEEPVVSTTAPNRAYDFTLTKKMGRKGHDVLKCLSEGYSYNEIAEETGITVDGVRYYIKKIFKHLGVNNGRDAVRMYLTEMKK